ncbi:MAG: universal stress protein [Flavobacteriaceae bacterium]
MRKIAIPTDLSENAKNAFEYAMELFNESSIFYILHAYAEAVFLPETLSLPDDQVENKKKEVAENCEIEINKLIEEMREKYPESNHQFRVLTNCGYLLNEVNQLVNSENIDVLVMGTRGKTNDRNLTFGSNTLQVLKQVQCPVLCIPENYAYKTPKKILFPTNYMIPYQKRELKLVDEICSYYNAEVHVLYVSNFGLVSKRQKTNQAFLKSTIDTDAIHFHQIEESSKTHIFNETIDKMEIDLLVMVNTRHSFLEAQLEKSTIDKVSLRPKIPFLILQNFKRN